MSSDDIKFIAANNDRVKETNLCDQISKYTLYWRNIQLSGGGLKDKSDQREALLWQKVYNNNFNITPEQLNKLAWEVEQEIK